MSTIIRFIVPSAIRHVIVRLKSTATNRLKAITVILFCLSLFIVPSVLLNQVKGEGQEIGAPGGNTLTFFITASSPSPDVDTWAIDIYHQGERILLTGAFVTNVPHIFETPPGPLKIKITFYRAYKTGHDIEYTVDNFTPTEGGLYYFNTTQHYLIYMGEFNSSTHGAEGLDADIRAVCDRLILTEGHHVLTKRVAYTYHYIARLVDGKTDAQGTGAVVVATFTGYQPLPPETGYPSMVFTIERWESGLVNSTPTIGWYVTIQQTTSDPCCAYLDNKKICSFSSYGVTEQGRVLNSTYVIKLNSTYGEAG